MTARRAPHMSMAHRWRSNRPFAERALSAIGATPAFTDAVLGDLAEERARLAVEQGPRRARWWYRREVLRALPHLAWNAIRHGGASGRSRVACMLAVVALAVTAVAAMLLRAPVPARLVVDGQRGGVDGIVLNTTQPVRLTSRALDARGKTLSLDSNAVRYEWTAGAAVRVASNGVVTCTQAGDAMVKASVRTVQATMVLHCRPVKEFLTQLWIPLVAGGASRDMHFTARDPDGQPVRLLAGDLHIADSTVATLAGSRLTPVSPGHTFVTMRIGAGRTTTSVSVFEPVRTFEERRPDQRFVVAPLQVPRRGTIRRSLPIGRFWLLYESAADSLPVPKFATEGPAACSPALGAGVPFTRCLVRGPTAALRIKHPGGTSATIAGRLSLEMDR